MALKITDANAKEIIGSGKPVVIGQHGAALAWQWPR